MEILKKFRMDATDSITTTMVYKSKRDKDTNMKIVDSTKYISMIVQHSQTKHIKVRYHFIKDHIEKWIMELYFVKTIYQLDDFFTKDLSEERFEYLHQRLGMSSMRVLDDSKVKIGTK
ncbi:hypothetical protein Tco_1473117 [Tanacetum coccineum]